MSHTEVIVNLMVERRELYSDVKTRVCKVKVIKTKQPTDSLFND